MYFKYPSKKLVLLAFLILALAALPANQRVALVKVASGSASLDKKVINKAQIAVEGEKLRLEKDTLVRVQLLGSSAELVLTTQKEPLEFVISKEQLMKDSKKVERGGVAVAQDMGSLNTTGASVTRGVEKPPSDKDLLKLRPQLPPLEEDGDYIIEFSAGPAFTIPSGDEITVELRPLDSTAQATFSKSFSSEETFRTLALTKSAIEIGAGYYFRLNYRSKPNGTDVQGLSYFYTQSFRILTTEQREFLDSAKEELLSGQNGKGDVVSLLRLASLYQDYDQNKEALKYLQMAYDRTPASDEATKKSIQAQIERFERAFDVAVPLTPAQEAP